MCVNERQSLRQRLRQSLGESLRQSLRQCVLLTHSISKLINPNKDSMREIRLLAKLTLNNVKSTTRRQNFETKYIQKRKS